MDELAGSDKTRRNTGLSVVIRLSNERSRHARCSEQCLGLASGMFLGSRRRLPDCWRISCWASDGKCSD